MKSLLIPLLVATALLSGCHRVSVRHSVDLPVTVIEHRHLHEGAVVVHKHPQQGHASTHHHSKPVHHTPKRVVVVTPPAVEHHREVTVHYRSNQHPAPPAHTRPHHRREEIPSHSGHSGSFMQRSVQRIGELGHRGEQTGPAIHHQGRDSRSAESRRPPSGMGARSDRRSVQPSAHREYAHRQSSRQAHRERNSSEERRGDSSRHYADNASHSDNSSDQHDRERSRGRDNSDHQKEKQREKEKGEDKRHRH